MVSFLYLNYRNSRQCCSVCGCAVQRITSACQDPQCIVRHHIARRVLPAGQDGWLGVQVSYLTASSSRRVSSVRFSKSVKLSVSPGCCSKMLKDEEGRMMEAVLC